MFQAKVGTFANEEDFSWKEMVLEKERLSWEFELISNGFNSPTSFFVFYPPPLLHQS